MRSREAGPGRRCAAAGWPARVHVLLAVGASMVPLLLLAGLLARLYVRAETERFEKGFRDLVFDTALTLERDLAGTVAVLEALATSPALREGELAAFRDQAGRVRDLVGGDIVLRDRAGRQVASTMRPWGAPLPEGSSLLRWDSEVLASGRPLVTGHYRGIINGEHSYAVVVPVPRGGSGDAVTHLLHASLPATRLRDIVRQARVPEGGVVGIVDRDLVVLARNARHEETVGTPSFGAARQREMRGDELFMRAVNRDGRDVFVVHRRLPTSGWLLSGGAPVEAVLAPLRRALWTAAAAGAGLTALALAGAWFFGRRLSDAIGRLAALGPALEADGPVAPPRTGVREVNEVGERLADAAARHALMVRELNHRVRNTLATVASMVSLSARHATSVADYEARLAGRVRSLGRTHLLLTDPGRAETGLEEILRNELAAHDAPGTGRVTLDGPPVPLPARRALAVGMLAHELATNAAKHGALSRPEGRVEVRWAVRDGPAGDGDGARAGPSLELVWREADGPPVAPPARAGFGTRLIERGVARDLGATVRADYAPDGLRFSLSMPIDAPP